MTEVLRQICFHHLRLCLPHKSMAMGVPQKEESEYCCPPLTFWASHIEVGAMYGGLLFVKESDFVSFISTLRREGKQLQDTDKMNSLKEELNKAG